MYLFRNLISNLMDYYSQMTGFLFDLDGTLVDSLPSIEKSWQILASELKINPPHIPDIHGIPAINTIAKYAPHLSSEELNWFSQRMEAVEVDTANLVQPVLGALEIIKYLSTNQIPWTIVTSCTSPLAIARLTAIGLSLPENSVTFEMVTKGKPDPEPFVMGAAKLKIEPADCWAIEDSINGLRSAKLAGCKTVGVLTHYEKAELTDAMHHVDNLMQILEFAF